LHDGFHVNEPWNSEPKQRFIQQMSAVFSSAGVDVSAGHPRFLMLRGETTVFSIGRKKIGSRDRAD